MSHERTKRVELVETANIFESLERLRKMAPLEDQRWRRALYHALCMTDISAAELTKIREAMHLP